MARTSEAVQQFDFSGGLFTESTELNFPENAATTLKNFDLRRDGSLRRRLGMDYETDYVKLLSLAQTTANSEAMTQFEWRSVDGAANRDFLVVQFGFTLYFFNQTSASFSANQVGSIDLSTYKLAGALGDKEFSFSAGNGFLFVVGEETSPVYIQYDPSTETFSATEITLKIRDFDGVDDSLEIDERPTTLSVQHRYNLRNQGWPKEFTGFENENGDRGNIVTDPIDLTKSKVGFYPSNADIIYLAKSASAEDTETIGAYSPWFLRKIVVGNTRAPRGHHILDAFNRDRNAASGLSGLSTESFSSRPSATAFFAGRVWYAGMTDGELTGTIYFSQLLTDVDKAGLCYQEQDPTAEQLNSLLATDGGAIEIPDVGRIYSLLAFDRSLVVVADNGVWQIVGSADTGFTASTFFIRFSTEIGAISASNIVRIQGGIMYWADSGVYLLSPNDVTGELGATNLTENTIQSTFLGITENSRKFAKGLYDRETNKILWIYNTNIGSTALPYKYDKALLLDISLNAWYEYEFSDLDSGTPFVVGVTKKQGLGIAEQVFDIVLGADDVVLGADDVVLTEDSGVSSTSSAVKFITLVPNGSNYNLTFSELKNRAFVDWETEDTVGKDYTSELVTGYQILGDGARDKQVKFWSVHFQRTEQNLVANSDGSGVEYDFPSAATARVRFEFTTSAAASRWSQTFEAYRLQVPYVASGAGVFDYSYDVITTKNRVRGHGRGVQFQITSQAGKDIRLLGWDVMFTGRTRF